MGDEIILEIKRRILVMVVDNPRLANLRVELETAALIGATIALEQKGVEDAAGVDTKECDVLSDEEQRKFAEEANSQPVKIGSVWI